MVKDYDCEILYHPLSHKVVAAPIMDIYLRMIVTSPLMDIIKEAQVEGLKKENWKTEHIRGQIPLFFRDSQGLLTRCGRVWVPTFGKVRKKISEEVHKSNFSIHPRAMKMHRDLRLSY